LSFTCLRSWPWTWSWTLIMTQNTIVLLVYVETLQPTFIIYTKCRSLWLNIIYSTIYSVFLPHYVGCQSNIEYNTNSLVTTFEVLTKTRTRAIVWTDLVSYAITAPSAQWLQPQQYRVKLVLLKECFVTQHPQSGTAYPNPSLLTFCVSFLLNVELNILIALTINDVSFYPHLRLFTIVYEFNVRHQPCYDYENPPWLIPTGRLLARDLLQAETVRRVSRVAEGSRREAYKFWVWNVNRFSWHGFSGQGFLIKPWCYFRPECGDSVYSWCLLSPGSFLSRSVCVSLCIWLILGGFVIVANEAANGLHYFKLSVLWFMHYLDSGW